MTQKIKKTLKVFNYLGTPNYFSEERLEAFAEFLYEKYNSEYEDLNKEIKGIINDMLIGEKEFDEEKAIINITRHLKYPK